MCKKILVVDDLEDTRTAVSLLLRAKDFEVTTAQSGIDAINALVEDPGIEILFTDIQLPNGLSGFQLARAVAEWHPHLRIVLGTGYNEDYLKKMAGYNPAFVILQKPYQLETLLRALGA